MSEDSLFRWLLPEFEVDVSETAFLGRVRSFFYKEYWLSRDPHIYFMRGIVFNRARS